MQEMNDLKNLVIQTLESQGVLSQLRAQIRSSVFRVIETQEKTSKSSHFTWENPLCSKIYESVEGPIALELMYEMLEFFKMDYTMNVFIHECNIKETTRRESLAEKIHLKKNDPKKPLLMCLINEAMNGPSLSGRAPVEPQVPAPNSQRANPSGGASKEAPSAANNIKGAPGASGSPAGQPSTASSKPAPPQAAPEQPKPKPVAKTAEDVPSSKPKLEIESPPSQAKPEKPANVQKAPANQKGKPAEAQKPTAKEAEEKKEEKRATGFNSNPNAGWPGEKREDSADYEENFEEEMSEDLPGESGEFSKSKHNANEEVVMSQSVGMDMSVDSMCLEEYDYYEDAEHPMA